MNYQPYLVKAMASEKHFWPAIDQKFIDLGLGGAYRSRKVISVINELPPQALMRAIKLLSINEHPEGRVWVAELMQKVFRKEIEKFDELNQKDDISFENFIRDTYHPKTSMSALTRKAAIFAALCDAIGMQCDDKFVESLLVDSSAIAQALPTNLEAARMADEWLKKHDTPLTLNEVSYDDELYPKEYYTYGVVSGSENIPLRAVEEYKFTKEDIRKIVNIAVAGGVPFDMDQLLVHSYIIKSIARYAEECKNAFLDMALSADVAVNKVRKSMLTKKESEVKDLQRQLDAKQEKLNAAQLTIDRLNQRNHELEQTISNNTLETAQLQAYIEVLEEQLDSQASSQDTIAEPIVLPDISDKKIVIVGGHSNWQNKLKALYPNFTFIKSDDFSFDVNLVRNADVVIFNFAHNSHKLYYRLKANRDNIVYIGNINIEQFNSVLMNAL